MKIDTHEKADLLSTVNSIAAFLGMPRGGVQARIDSGLIPTFRIGGTICARRSTLNEWLAELDAAAKAERVARREAAASAKPAAPAPLTVLAGGKGAGHGRRS